MAENWGKVKFNQRDKRVQRVKPDQYTKAKKNRLSQMRWPKKLVIVLNSILSLTASPSPTFLDAPALSSRKSIQLPK
ncbi:hypothetical protein A3C68_00895 [Candidatus Kuenenbacteria bacterium RIFCSPHIGHO2_02_FULL_42_29]|nr:MAG: hypothetical protein A3C68_00895 [Candidatus Kuenenbacteria bacterium RIFCSPHIGHO2_02_FULL_42_29]